MKNLNKSCELDPIPTWLLKCCLTELLPLITTLVNKPLTTGSFPEGFKLALIKPQTALLKIYNDIVTSLDQKKCTLLASFDLSVAFDTADHSILIHRLQYEYGIGRVALQWFRSYLLDRNQIVSVQGRKSNIHHL